MTKKKKRQSRFADMIVAICLSMSAIVTCYNMYEYHRLEEVMPSGVVSALLVLWGGELLILAVRQIFGSDVIGKAKGSTNSAPASDDAESI